MPLLLLASLFYYGYWNFWNLRIIVMSIFVNYAFSVVLSHASGFRRFFFVLGILFNLGLLAYFKYTDFLILNVDAVFGLALPLQDIALPIGISFFTFQQIAYLVDVYKKEFDPCGKGVVNYALFISFFPQLVAGPIVLHKELMPQLADVNALKVQWANVYRGFVLLSIGLAKKVIVADSLSPFVAYCFDIIPGMTFLEALFGSIAYSFQLYFDFSGYSDMAVGCALFFNVHIPFNFISPYRASSPQDFWRRWHVTLSRWLGAYVYIPMGGSRVGTARTLMNIFMTFVLGGLWHGAAWTFVFWGGVHGVALSLHRMWRVFFSLRFPKVLAIVVTFFYVNVAWIPFRAMSFERVGIFVDAFLGKNGIGLRQSFQEHVVQQVYAGHLEWKMLLVMLASLFLVVFFCKNSLEISACPPTMRKTVYCIGLILISFVFMASPERISEFIYFQF